jgi:hypothetical protein
VGRRLFRFDNPSAIGTLSGGTAGPGNLIGPDGSGAVWALGRKPGGHASLCGPRQNVHSLESFLHLATQALGVVSSAVTLHGSQHTGKDLADTARSPGLYEEVDGSLGAIVCLVELVDFDVAARGA